MNEKTITVQELINFMQNNYKLNIANKKLEDFLSIYLDWYSYSIKRIEIKGEYFLEFKYNNEKFVLCKKDKIFYILSKNISLSQQDKLLRNFDFSEVFNYFVQEQINDTIEISAYYLGSKNDKYDLTISYHYAKIAIGIRDYEFVYKIDKYYDLICSENITTDNLEDLYFLKTLYSTDSEFLNKIIINFSSLPTYIQKSYEENPHLFKNIKEEGNVSIQEIKSEKPKSKFLSLFSKK